MENLPQSKFKHGQIFCTEEVKELMHSNKEFKTYATRCLAKYFLGNWGNGVSVDEWMLNDRAMRTGERIMARYEDCAITRKESFPVLIISTEPRGEKTVLFFSREV